MFDLCYTLLRWPGALARSSNYAAVFAHLILPDGKNYGMHAFLAQIRDGNHDPMLGIEVGDIGELVARLRGEGVSPLYTSFHTFVYAHTSCFFFFISRAKTRCKNRLHRCNHLFIILSLSSQSCSFSPSPPCSSTPSTMATSA